MLGANGAGKTTLMRSIAGLEPPRATGEIRLSGAASTSCRHISALAPASCWCPRGDRCFRN